MYKTYFAAGVVAMAVGGAAAPAQALVIDTYDTEHSVSATGGTQASEIEAPEALGGWRHLYVENAQGDYENGTTLKVYEGVLGFSNQVNASGRGWITYDGQGGFDGTEGSVDTSGLGGVDFLVGPDPFMNFDVASFESNLYVQIDVWDMDGSRVSYDEVLPPAGDFTPLLPLTDFDLVSGQTFDWSRVGAVQFFVESYINSNDPDGGYDGSIDRVTVDPVPLPASALLVLGGLGGFAALRGRRRNG